MHQRPASTPRSGPTTAREHTLHDLIVIGAGSAGLSAAALAASVGADVALIEANAIGGDCTWTGCVPSKALLHIAKAAHTVRTAGHLGLQTQLTGVDMAQVRRTIAARIQEVYQHESPQALANKGITVITGRARFTSPDTIVVSGQPMRARHFILCTGAHPRPLNIPGIDTVTAHNHHTIFDNDRLPEHLIVVGAGPIGAEIAQAYGRLGAQVSLVGPALLPKESPQTTAIIQEALQHSGARFIPARAASVCPNSPHPHGLTLTLNDGQQIHGDMLMVAIGRTANIDGLGLDQAGIQTTHGVIHVNSTLHTSNPRVLAAGDCNGSPQFTHLAGWQGVMAARNALFPLQTDALGRRPPRVTFTDPEVAAVGLSFAQAKQRFGQHALRAHRPLTHVDRAVCDHATAGFIELIHHSDGRLLGATLVGPRAGDALSGLVVALEHNLKLKELATALHPYPTYAIGIQQLAADLYTQQSLDTTAVRLLKKWKGYHKA